MAEFYIGPRERIIWIEETSYGTGGTLANALVIGYNHRITQSFNQNFQEVLTAGSDDRKVKSLVYGVLSLPFSITYNLENWRFLKYIFDITTETGTAPTTHTLDIGNTLKSFKLEWAKRHTATPQVYLITGGVVMNTRISFQKATGEGQEGFVIVSHECIAQDYTSPASEQGSISSLSGVPYQFRHCKLTINSSEVVEVNSGEISIAQGITINDSLYANATLNRKIGEPIPTILRITGKFNLNVKDLTYSDLWEAAAAISGTNKLEFIRTSGSDEAVWTFTNLTCSPAPVGNTNLEGVDNAEFIFQATSVQVVTKDSVANY
jgi:hypothetical protein